MLEQGRAHLVRMTYRLVTSAQPPVLVSRDGIQFLDKNGEIARQKKIRLKI